MHGRQGPHVRLQLRRGESRKGLGLTMRRNLYPARCYACRRYVAAGCGRLGRVKGARAVACESCAMVAESAQDLRRRGQIGEGENQSLDGENPASVTHTTCSVPDSAEPAKHTSGLVGMENAIETVAGETGRKA